MHGFKLEFKHTLKTTQHTNSKMTICTNVTKLTSCKKKQKFVAVLLEIHYLLSLELRFMLIFTGKYLKVAAMESSSTVLSAKNLEMLTVKYI